MGYDCGTGQLDDMTRKAIRDFQEDNDLKPISDEATEVDKVTRDKIEEKYSE